MNNKGEIVQEYRKIMVIAHQGWYVGRLPVLSEAPQGMKIG